MRMKLQINNSVEYEFYKNYAENIAPLFEEFEKKRQKKFWIFVILEIFLAGLTLIAEHFFYIPFIAAILILCPAMIAIPYFMNRNFQKKLKESCMYKLLNVFGKIKWLNGATIISDNEIRESEIFGTYTDREDDDCFKGIFDGVEFEISETRLLNIIKDQKNAWIWQVFKGVIISFSSNKNIKNKTIVTTKGDINTRNSNPLLWFITIYVCIVFGFNIYICDFTSDFTFAVLWLLLLMGATIFCLFLIIIKFYQNKRTEKLNKITLEDPVFNRKYNAYSSDEIEGRYLLTTAFMERFKNLHTAFGTSRAKCSFYDDRIMFSISTRKNLFEIGSLFFPVNNPKQINVFLKEISAIYELIDYFKLDERTGL